MHIDLNKVLIKLSVDRKTSTNHFALVMALIYFASNGESKRNRIRISRKSLMEFARIGSITTYHRAIRDLCSMGVIGYNPSFDPRKFTEVTFLDSK